MAERLEALMEGALVIRACSAKDFTPLFQRASKIAHQLPLFVALPGRWDGADATCHRASARDPAAAAAEM